MKWRRVDGLERATKPITHYSGFWFMKGINGGGRSSSTNQLHSLHSKKNNFSFRFVHFVNCFDEMDEVKRYYNSISRQSGIVHKDKAMRQLDLDLLTMSDCGSSGWPLPKGTVQFIHSLKWMIAVPLVGERARSESKRKSKVLVLICVAERKSEWGPLGSAINQQLNEIKQMVNEMKRLINEMKLWVMAGAQPSAQLNFISNNLQLFSISWSLLHLCDAPAKNKRNEDNWRDWLNVFERMKIIDGKEKRRLMGELSQQSITKQPATNVSWVKGQLFNHFNLPFLFKQNKSTALHSINQNKSINFLIELLLMIDERAGSAAISLRMEWNENKE